MMCLQEEKLWFTFAARVCRYLSIIILFWFHISYPWTWSCPMFNLFFGLCFFADFWRHVLWLMSTFLDQFDPLYLEPKYVYFLFPYCFLAVYYVFQVFKIKIVNENCCLHCVYFRLHLFSFNKLQHCSAWLSCFVFLLPSTCTHDNFRF